MPVRSAWLINRTDTTTGQSRTDTRLAPTGTMAPAGPLTSASGVVPGSKDGKYLMDGLYVFGDAAGMTASVAPGRAVIQSYGPAGAYPVVLTDYEPITFDDGDASNPRIDLVVLRVYDTQYDASGRTEAVLEIVKGTPAGTPEVPATPDAALPLARVTVPAGASVGTGGLDWSSAVYDLRNSTVAVGGILAESWNRGVPGGYAGQYRDTGGRLQRWDGTAWASYPRQIGGIAPQGALAAGEYVGQYRDEGGRLQRWDGTVWRPIVPTTGWDYNNDGGYVKSTGYVENLTDTGRPSIAANFTTPVSGAIMVTLGFQGRAGADNRWVRMSANIRLAGALVLAADEVRAAIVNGGVVQSASAMFRVTGLKPHTQYSAVAAYQHSVTDTTAWIDNRYIRVDPVV
ncbi:hypothetical protein [Streptomyces sp. NPDC047928]|uniref:hypothetical protein n=1 Tax=unclassified Streptomyces TaxID=2593676 RepID=UPI003722A8B0